MGVLESAIERLTARTAILPNGCWESSLGLETGGYSQVWVAAEGRLLKAHVVSWRFFVGPVPDGLELDHLCRNRRCWNPMHLEPVTHAENVRRGAGAALHRQKTHCPRGHEYDPANTRVRRQSRGSGLMRECRACCRDRERRRRAAA